MILIQIKTIKIIAGIILGLDLVGLITCGIISIVETRKEAKKKWTHKEY